MAMLTLASLNGLEVVQRLLSHPLAERIGWTLLHSLWQGAAVATLLPVVLFALRARSAGARYLASCAAMLVIALAPVVTFFVLPGSPHRSVAASPSITSDPTESVAMPPVNLRDDARPQRVTMRDLLRPALPWLVLGWSAGVFTLSLQHIGGWLRVRRMKSRNEALTG